MALHTRFQAAAALMAALGASAAPCADGDPWNASRLGAEICGEDEWRGFNRAMFAVGDFSMEWIADPLSRLYCSILPAPLIRGVDNAIDNSEYPRRLVATLLRGEFAGAWDESMRFVVNSTIGIGGLFDAADGLGIHSTDASMSGTFAAWGVGRGNSLALPFVPRANVRDCTGYIIDQGLDPKTYLNVFFPTGIGIGWSAAFWPNYAAEWIGPWQENISASRDHYASFRELVSAKSLLDEDLSVHRYEKSLDHRTAESRRPPIRLPLARPAHLKGRWRDIDGFDPRSPALDTLRIRCFAPRRNHDFWWERKSVFNRDFAKTVHVQETIVTTNFPAAEYGFVRADSDDTIAGRLVFVVPGIGGSHDSNSTLAFAEMLTEAGADVVLCDDHFHWRYVESANCGIMPGYLPDDARRFAAFVRAVLGDLGKDGIASNTEVSVVGWSMGGLLTAHLAALDARGELGFRSGQMLSVNPPVSFDSVADAMDGLLAPSRKWDAHDAKSNFVEIMRRLAVWDRQGNAVTPDISEDDARYTVAIAIGRSLNGSVRDYFGSCVCAAHQERDPKELEREAGLLGIEKEMKGNSKLAIIHTWDDFLLDDSDRSYLDRTMEDRITWFSAGAHCGMFYTDEFRTEVLSRLGLPNKRKER